MQRCKLCYVGVGGCGWWGLGGGRSIIPASWLGSPLKNAGHPYYIYTCTDTHLTPLRAGARPHSLPRHLQQPPQMRGQAPGQPHPAAARLEQEELIPVGWRAFGFGIWGLGFLS